MAPFILEEKQMVINLDAYIERTVDFKLNGEIVKVKELSNTLFKKVATHEKTVEVDGGVKVFEERLAIVAEILNRNTTGHKFTQEQIAEFPQSVLNVVLQEVSALTRKGIEDPN